MGASKLRLHYASRLVVSQANEEFEAKDQRIVSYLKEVRILNGQFEKVDILQISKGSNSHADSLATLASSIAEPLPRILYVELLPSPSTLPPAEAMISRIRPSLSWMDPFVTYLQGGNLPKDRKEAEKIKQKSPSIRYLKKENCTKDRT